MSDKGPQMRRKEDLRFYKGSFETDSQRNTLVVCSSNLCLGTDITQELSDKTSHLTYCNIIL